MSQKNYATSFQAASLCLPIKNQVAVFQGNSEVLGYGQLKPINRNDATVHNSHSDLSGLFGWMIRCSNWMLDKLAINQTDEKKVIPEKFSEAGKTVKREPNHYTAEISDINTYIKRAYDYFLRGDTQRAMEEFNQAIAQNPHSAYLYGERAHFRRKNLGDQAGAIEDYSQAIYIEPQNPLLFIWRSQVYNSLGKIKKSIEDYNTAINLSPKDTMYYCFHGAADFNE